MCRSSCAAMSNSEMASSIKVGECGRLGSAPSPVKSRDRNSSKQLRQAVTHSSVSETKSAGGKTWRESPCASNVLISISRLLSILESSPSNLPAPIGADPPLPAKVPPSVNMPPFSQNGRTQLRGRELTRICSVRGYCLVKIRVANAKRHPAGSNSQRGVREVNGRG